MVRNTYIYPPEPSMRIVADIIEYTARAHAAVQLDLDLRLPHAGGRRDGRPGARPSRSPTASSTCASATGRGLDIDAFAGRLSFFFAIGMNFFMEVAKLRAARLLWARVMRAVRARRSPASLMLRTHCQTSRRVAHRAGPVQQHRAHRRSRRWPRCSAARRACTPTRFDEALGAARPTSRPASPATPS